MVRHAYMRRSVRVLGRDRLIRARHMRWTFVLDEAGLVLDFEAAPD